MSNAMIELAFHGRRSKEARLKDGTVVVIACAFERVYGPENASDEPILRVTAHDGNAQIGKLIIGPMWWPQKNRSPSESSIPWTPFGEPGVEVVRERRRLGVATLMYDMAVDVLGERFEFSDDLTDDGKAFRRAYAAASSVVANPPLS